MQPGRSLREAWRIARVSLAGEPLVALIRPVLADALDVPNLEIDLEPARAADRVQLARGVSGLTAAGVPVDRALSIMGLSE